jgi:hypothetical protein
LFYGRNSGGTHVFTAVTRDNQDILSFNEDFYPLFKYILEQAHKHIDTPENLPKDPWLGIIEFGTETWLSNGNVTFTAANFGMEISGNVSESGHNTTRGDGEDKDNKDEDDKAGGGGEEGDNSTDSSSKGDEEDNAVRLRSQSVLGYVVAAAVIVSAVMS